MGENEKNMNDMNDMNNSTQESPERLRGNEGTPTGLPQQGAGGAPGANPMSPQADGIRGGGTGPSANMGNSGSQANNSPASPVGNALKAAGKFAKGLGSFGFSMAKSFVVPAALVGGAFMATTALVSTYTLTHRIIPSDSNLTNVEYPPNTEIGQTSLVLSDVFYQKYADESFYFTLSEPDDEAKALELEKYSGKKYNEHEEGEAVFPENPLKGEKDRGITQSSYTNYIQDIDNYEENIKLQPGFLAGLDQDLNGAGTTGYYQPEQFIKMVYIPKTEHCDVKANDTKENELDVFSCSLGDVKEAKSVEWIKNEQEGIYERGEDEVVSPTDWGLGSLVHYQAYFEPSRIAEYKIGETCYFDPEWNPGDDGGPRKCAPYNDVPATELTKYTSWWVEETSPETYQYYYNHDRLDTEGQVDINEGQNSHGLYDVNEEIYYQDWAKAYYGIDGEKEKTPKHGDPYINNGLDWSDWSQSDPWVSTGVLDTNVVYVIDRAITYFGDIDFKVNQEWTTLSKATNEMTTHYLKDFDVGAPVFSTDVDYKTGQEGTQDLYRIVRYAGAAQYGVEWESQGYSSSNEVEWEDFEIEFEETSKDIKNTEAYCAETLGLTRPVGDVYVPNDPESAKWNNCIYDTHSVPWYTVKVKQGKWKFTTVRNANGEKDSGEVEIESSVPLGEFAYDGDNLDEARAHYNAARSKLNENYAKQYSEKNSQWKLEPSYVVNITASASGKLQSYLVSHYDVYIDSDQNSLDYITDYVRNYTGIIPDDEESQFECFDALDPNNEYEGLKTNKYIGSCKDENYVMKINEKQSAMSTMGLYEMPNNQISRIRAELGFTDEKQSDSIYFDPASLEIINHNLEDDKAEIEAIKVKYEEYMEESYGRYGIDPNLIVAMMYASEKYDYPYIFNNRTNGTYKIKNMSNQRNKEHWVEEKELLTDEDPGVYAEHVIDYMEMKMQVLMEEYNGNLPLALLDYSMGDKMVEVVLNLYEKETGISKDYLLEYDKYDTGWWHYIPEILGEGGKDYHFHPTIRNRDWIKTVLENIQSSRVIWNKMTDIQEEHEHKDPDKANTIEITTLYWNRFSLYDSLKATLKTEAIRKETRTALYDLRRVLSQSEKEHTYGTAASTKLEMYWGLLTANQKWWNSASYIEYPNEHPENGKYNPNKEDAYTKAIIKQKQMSLTDAQSLVKSALARDSDVKYSDVDLRSRQYWLNRFGNLKIRPDYKTIIGETIYWPTMDYETYMTLGHNSLPGGVEEISKGWVILVAPGEEWTALTPGEVVGLTDSRVMMEVNDAIIIYDGLSDIDLKLHDKDPEKLGTAGGELWKDDNGVVWNKVTISVIKDDEYYDMYDFVDQYTMDLALGSDFFFSLGGYWGSWCTADPMAAMERYNEIAAYQQNSSKSIGGGGDKYQCVTYVNYRLGQIINCGGKGEDLTGVTVGGNGENKVTRLMENPTTKKYLSYTSLGCPDKKENIIFQYESGEYGHTGYIESYSCQMVNGKKEIAVVISHSNGLRHKLAENSVLTGDEWENFFHGNAGWKFVQVNAPKECINMAKPNSPLMAHVDGVCTAINSLDEIILGDNNNSARRIDMPQ